MAGTLIIGFLSEAQFMEPKSAALRPSGRQGCRRAVDRHILSWDGQRLKKSLGVWMKPGGRYRDSAGAGRRLRARSRAAATRSRRAAQATMHSVKTPTAPHAPGRLSLR